jgi:hypothetical protein
MLGHSQLVNSFIYKEELTTVLRNVTNYWDINFFHIRCFHILYFNFRMNIKNIIHLKFIGCKKVRASLVVANSINIHVGTHSSRDNPGLCILKSSVPVPCKIQFRTPKSRVFPSHKIWHFWQCEWTFWFQREGRKQVQELGIHQPATNLKELDRERKMCRLVSIEFGLRLRRTWDVDLYVKENPSVIKLRIIIIILCQFLFDFSCCNNINNNINDCIVKHGGWKILSSTPTTQMLYPGFGF